jgi:hypothetical protein
MVLLPIKMKGARRHAGRRHWKFDELDDSVLRLPRLRFLKLWIDPRAGIARRHARNPLRIFSDFKPIKG